MEIRIQMRRLGGKGNATPQMNIDIFGALLRLRIQYEYTRTQCKEGDKYVTYYMSLVISIKMNQYNL